MGSDATSSLHKLTRRLHCCRVSPHKQHALTPVVLQDGPETHATDGYGHDMTDATDVPLGPPPLAPAPVVSENTADDRSVDLKTSHSFGDTIADAGLPLMNPNLRVTVHSPQKALKPSIIPGEEMQYAMALVQAQARPDSHPPPPHGPDFSC
jgi:hypothetical protein